METEKFIQQQLASLDFPCTKFIIAQRITSVKNADKILVLDGCKITEMGTHEAFTMNSIRCSTANRSPQRQVISDGPQ